MTIYVYSFLISNVKTGCLLHNKKLLYVYILFLCKYEIAKHHRKPMSATSFKFNRWSLRNASQYISLCKAKRNTSAFVLQSMAVEDNWIANRKSCQSYIPIYFH